MLHSIIIEQSAIAYRVAVIDVEKGVVCEMADIPKGAINIAHVYPLNFSLQNGQVVEDCGKFDRLGGLIVLAELHEDRKIKGYRVFDSRTCKIINIVKRDLLEYSKVNTVQNAIIRNNQVACFPNKPFLEINISKEKEPVRGRQKKEDVPSNVKAMSALKRRGFSSYLCNPKLKPETVKYFAQHIMDEETAKRCKPIANNPKLNLHQVETLSGYAMFGVDIADICDENMSAITMDVEARKRYMQMCGDIDTEPVEDEALLDICINYKNKIR